MNVELVVWLVSLASVLLVGWAWGRSSRPTVYVRFPEAHIDRLKPTAREVAAAMRRANDDDECTCQGPVRCHHDGMWP